MGSFRRHVHTRAGSARITPLWLSCSPNRTHLPGFEARNRIHGSWFTGGPNQSIEVGQFRVSNSKGHERRLPGSNVKTCQICGSGSVVSNLWALLRRIVRRDSLEGLVSRLRALRQQLLGINRSLPEVPFDCGKPACDVTLCCLPGISSGCVLTDRNFEVLVETLKGGCLRKGPEDGGLSRRVVLISFHVDRIEDLNGSAPFFCFGLRDGTFALRAEVS